MYFYLSLNLIKQSGYDVDLGLIKRDLGEYYRAVNNLDEAIKLLQESESIFVKLNDSLNLAKTYNRLAAVIHEQLKSEKAIEFAWKSQALIEKNKHYALQSNNFNIIAVNKKEIDSAEFYILKAMKLAELDISNIELITIYTNIAIFYQKINRLDEAEQFGLKGYDISFKNTFKGGIAHAARVLSGIYADMNDYKQAYHYSHIAYNYREKIMNEDRKSVV